MLSMYFQGWERYIERMFIYCGYELKFYLGNFVKKQKKLKKKQKNTYLKHYIIEKNMTFIQKITLISIFAH